MTPYTAPEDRYATMNYRRCGRSGLKLPAISLGLWQNFGSVDVFETGRAVVRRAFESGVTHFDLANNYGPVRGSAEENFGRILADDLRPYRDELIVSTKAGYGMWPGPYGEWGSRKYLLASLDQSLKRMGLDYVDIFYSHRFDPDTPLEETMGALDAAVRQGKALYAGISSYSPEATRRAAALLDRSRHALPHPPALLFDAQPLGRGRAPRHARRTRHRLHRLLAAGTGHADEKVSRRRAGRIAGEPRRLPVGAAPDARQCRPHARPRRHRGAARTVAAPDGARLGAARSAHHRGADRRAQRRAARRFPRRVRIRPDFRTRSCARSTAPRPRAASTSGAPPRRRADSILGARPQAPASPRRRPPPASRRKSPGPGGGRR